MSSCFRFLSAIMCLIYTSVYSTQTIHIVPRGKGSPITMQTNKKTTIGDIRKFIQKSNNHLPGQLMLDGNALSDDTLLKHKDIFNSSSHGVVEYKVSNPLPFKANMSWVTPDGDKISVSISPNIYIGSTIYFDEAAVNIISSLTNTGLQIDYQAPILFVFLNCCNDYVLMRDYLCGCTSFKLYQEMDTEHVKFINMDEPVGERGVLTHNIHDAWMLQDLLKLKLSKRDSLVWHPQFPKTTKIQLYYDEPFYIFVLDISQYGNMYVKLSKRRLSKRHWHKKIKVTAPKEVKSACCSLQ